MLKKKYLFGTILCGAILCSLLAFNSLVFPSVMAAKPENTKVQSIADSKVASEIATTSSESTTEQTIDPSNVPGANEISEKKAVQIAKDALKNITDVSKLQYDAKLAHGSIPSPFDVASWDIMFTGNESCFFVVVNATNGKVASLTDYTNVTK